MLPLVEDAPVRPPLVPPTFQLSHFERPLSVIHVDAIPVEVHFVSGNAQPIVYCNGAAPEACVLCRAGFPVLKRELILAYDYREDRLWATPLPEWLWDKILSEAHYRPEYDRNFLIHWTGRGYGVQHDASNFAREYTLVQEERENVKWMLQSGQIDLKGAVPRLCSAEMLRLPALLDAAMYFGLDGLPDESVDIADGSTIHS